MHHPRQPLPWLTVGLFVGIYALLHIGYQFLRDSRWATLLIDTFTVAPAAWLAALVMGDADVQAIGSQLLWPGGRLTLRVGCDGFELMAILVASTLVAPIAWQRGLPSLVAGMLLVWAANQFRIVALYWSFRYHREWFDALHVVWLPLALVVLTAAYFKLVVLAGRSRQGSPLAALA